MTTYIEEVAQGTYRLEAQIPGLDTIFAVYFIKETSDIIIEPGPAALIPAIQAKVKELALRNLEYIIPTHIHLDHAGAVGRLAELFPEAKVVIHPLGARHVIDPSRLIQGTKAAFGNDFETRYGEILPVPEGQVKVPTDGEVLDTGDRGLKVIFAPGHAPHHIAIFDEKTKGLFSGEALGTPVPGAESFVLPSAAPPIFDIDVSLDTVEKLRRLSPHLIFYSHDGVGKEPEALVKSVTENTKAIGDLILKALKEKRSPEAIEGIVESFILALTGRKAEALAVKMAVGGYIPYFQKKGLA